MNNGSQIQADNFNDLFLMSAFTINELGEWTKPRGFDCKEIVNAQLILNNPSNALITIKERKLNYAYLIIEKFMYLSQICEPEILIAYNAQMKNYLNQDTNNFDGAYGPRIGKNKQLDYCYNQLKEDKYSRQALVTINDYTDRRVSLDKPCTLSWQFMIRENKLHMTANMRSNDLMWGTCLDIPAFCFIQEVLAFWLGVKQGTYTHNATSLHYYKEQEEKVLDILKPTKQFDLDYRIQNLNEVNNEIIPVWNIPYDKTKDALNEFWKNEKCIREKRFYSSTKYIVINKYLERLLRYWKNKDERTKNTNRIKRNI